MSNIYAMADTWNAAGTTFTAILMNVTNGAGGAPVSAAGSLLLDLQINSASQFSVSKGGAIISASDIACGGSLIVGNNGSNKFVYWANIGSYIAAPLDGVWKFFDGGSAGFTLSRLGGDGFVTLFNAARTGFTSLQFGGITSSFGQIKVSGPALGFRRADDTIGTFANLPAAAAANEGSVYAISDSSTATWRATITGGGANHVLAYSNGTNWTVAA